MFEIPDSGQRSRTASGREREFDGGSSRIGRHPANTSRLRKIGACHKAVSGSTGCPAYDSLITKEGCNKSAQRPHATKGRMLAWLYDATSGPQHGKFYRLFVACG